MSSPRCSNLKLVSTVENARCIQDLMPLLNSIFNLTEMKDIVKQRLSTLNIQQKQKAYLKASPIDEVLPRCIVQHIIGFNGDLRQTELVNKTFHECCDSVQRLVLRQQPMDWQSEFNNLHSDFKGNRIINVYPSAHYNTLPCAIEHANPGDTLLIHQGVYEFQDFYTLDKNIKLIGYGSDDVVIKASNGSDVYEIIFYAPYIYIRNITFNIAKECLLGTQNSECGQDGSCLFYMENCVINSNWTGLVLATTKTVKIRNCIIKGSERSEMGFDVIYLPTDILQIESCIFENCCRNSSLAPDVLVSHCIVLQNEITKGRQVSQRTRLKCISNHFKNNLGLGIVAANPSEINMEDSQIMNNIWSSDIDLDNSIPLLRDVNANKVYSHAEILEQHET